MPRVFSKVLAASRETTAINPITELAADVWTVEEDITVIGCEVMGGGMLDVDLVAAGILAPACEVELSQVAKMYGDGVILRAWKRFVAYTDTGTVRAPWNIDTVHAIEWIMFPGGHGMPVHEGGSVYLNINYWPGVADKCLWTFIGIIYYIKGAVG